MERSIQAGLDVDDHKSDRAAKDRLGSLRRRVELTRFRGHCSPIGGGVLTLVPKRDNS